MYATVVRGVGYFVADVFLSYAREDLPFVRRLTAALRARNREVWVDLEGIIPSARWMEEIRTAITAGRAELAVLPGRYRLRGRRRPARRDPGYVPWPGPPAHQAAHPGPRVGNPRP
ncbi:MAG: toll/interleukin-1 receptor domain-containing protein [Pseudonocardiaceae bacterium]